MEFHCKRVLLNFMSNFLIILLHIFKNKTRGLLGNFNWNTENDLILPNEKIISINTDNFEILHREFAMKCKIDLSVPFVL